MMQFTDVVRQNNSHIYSSAFLLPQNNPSVFGTSERNQFLSGFKAYIRFYMSTSEYYFLIYSSKKTVDTETFRFLKVHKTFDDKILCKKKLSVKTFLS